MHMGCSHSTEASDAASSASTTHAASMEQKGQRCADAAPAESAPAVELHGAAPVEAVLAVHVAEEPGAAPAEAVFVEETPVYVELAAAAAPAASAPAEPAATEAALAEVTLLVEEEPLVDAVSTAQAAEAAADEVAVPVAGEPGPALPAASEPAAGALPRADRPTVASLLPDKKVKRHVPNEWDLLGPEELEVLRKTRGWLGADLLARTPMDLLVAFPRGYAYKPDWAESCATYLERALLWRAEAGADSILQEVLPRRALFEELCASGTIGHDAHGHVRTDSPAVPIPSPSPRT